MSDRKRSPSRHRRVALIGAGALFLWLLAGAGAAFAVSGGGYQPTQQGCQPGDSDYATPNLVTYPGCHFGALNVESGGMTEGVADANNTRYVTYGINQVPVDPKSVGTQTEESIGLPGYTGDPHSGCLAVNTDGTTGGPASASTKPEAPGTAEQYRGGCGDNPKGLGFEANYDYYQEYCPIAAMLGFKCEDKDPGTNSVAPDTGGAVNVTPIIENGLIVYYGMDDNFDNGEHDGVGPYSALTDQNNNGAENGASDGGGTTVSFTPQTIARAPSMTGIEGLFNASVGFCADGICAEGTSQQQRLYQGCGAPVAKGQAPCDPGTPQKANVYDYAPDGSRANDPSVNSESAACNSGDADTTSEKSCGPGGMNALRSATPANVYAEPGVQLYSDPDSQRSPAVPAPLWPTPALYVGSCGVYAGSPATTGLLLGEKAMRIAGIQVINKDGQIAIDPDPSVC